MISLAPAGWWRGLGNLTRSGSSVEGLAWALYDFANTIYSFAIVSFAMGLWAVHFLGEAQGQLWFTVTVSASVAVNAAVSPVLGAMSDRTGGRKAYLLVFTALCIVATGLIAVAGICVGLLFFGIANFAYQAALIYYDAMLPDVARSGMRGRLSGVGVALGYLGTIVSGILLTRFGTSAEGDPTPATFLLVASLFTLFAIPIFVRVPDRSTGSGRLPRPGGAAVVEPAARDDSPCPRGSRPAALRGRALLLLRPGQHRHRGDERLCHRGGGVQEWRGAGRDPAAHDHRGDRIVRVGRAQRPHRPQAHPDDRAGDLGDRAGADHGHALEDPVPLRRARCSVRGSAALASRTGCSSCAWHRPHRWARCWDCTGSPANSAQSSVH